MQITSLAVRSFRWETAVGFHRFHPGRVRRAGYLHAEGGALATPADRLPPRDSLIGALFLGIGEVLDPNEQLADRRSTRTRS